MKMSSKKGLMNTTIWIAIRSVSETGRVSEIYSSNIRKKRSFRSFTQSLDKRRHHSSGGDYHSTKEKTVLYTQYSVLKWKREYLISFWIQLIWCYKIFLFLSSEYEKTRMKKKTFKTNELSADPFFLIEHWLNNVLYQTKFELI